MITEHMLDHSEEPSPSAAIYDHFRGLIVSGRLGSGERLPTVRQTAADLGVAAGTAARAYKQLERDGFVISRTAAGTRVDPSASLLPGVVVTRIRELVTIANGEGAHIEDVLTALRAEWGAVCRSGHQG